MSGGGPLSLVITRTRDHPAHTLTGVRQTATAHDADSYQRFRQGIVYLVWVNFFSSDTVRA